MAPKKAINYVLLALFLAFGFSCKKEEQEPVDLGLEYYPVTPGTWVQYKVMEVNHDEAVSIHDTTYYELKELIESTFVDNQGRPSVRIERYKRSDSLSNWQISDVWYATQTNSGLEKIEEDVRFLRMSYPVREEREWNGNVYNQQAAWDYFYEDIESVRTYNNLYFENTLKINQRYNHNLVEFENSFEVYAKHIGLIRKLYKDFTIINFDTLHPVLGTEIHQTVTGYGSN
ncbi:MAG: hypothetical protein ACHQF2_10425 [Flavobacteriales bacterium]